MTKTMSKFLRFDYVVVGGGSAGAVLAAGIFQYEYRFFVGLGEKKWPNCPSCV